MEVFPSACKGFLKYVLCNGWIFGKPIGVTIKRLVEAFHQTFELFILTAQIELTFYWQLTYQIKTLSLVYFFHPNVKKVSLRMEQEI